MLDDLKTFFTLTTNFRSRTSNSMQRLIILRDALPDLAAKTRSQRLKNAIGKFLMENKHADRNAPKSA